MADIYSKKRRSEIMSRIRGKDTKPEKQLRSYLHKKGYRFRVNHKILPGKPDICLPKYKTVIFIHGCFWHSHKGCRRAKLPTSNRAFWERKIKANAKRDKKNERLLQEQGWKVLTIWQCELDALLKAKKDWTQKIKR